MKSKRNKPVLLQIYDYAQMFDSINLKMATFALTVTQSRKILLYIETVQIEGLRITFLSIFFM